MGEGIITLRRKIVFSENKTRIPKIFGKNYGFENIGEATLGGPVAGIKLLEPRTKATVYGGGPKILGSGRFCPARKKSQLPPKKRKNYAETWKKWDFPKRPQNGWFECAEIGK